MSHPEPYVSDVRTSAQRPREGIIKVPFRWYQDFLDSNPGTILHGWERISATRRREKVERLLPFGLKADVLDKLVRSEGYTIKRIVNLLLAFEDNLIFSDPEWFPMIYMGGYYRRFMRWVVSSEVYHPGSPVDQWKKFTQLVYWKAFKSLTDKPKTPENFPGVSRHADPLERDLPYLWEVLTPWLKPIWNGGLQTKFECTRLAHFLTSRNMPAAAKPKREASLRKHFEVLTSEGPNDPSRRQWLYEAAAHVGRSLRDHTRPSLKGAHLSVTNSASYLSSIKDGGRGLEVSYHFREWTMKVPAEDADRTTWFGKQYRHRAGVAQWRTMCRPDDAQDGLPGDSALIDEVDFTPGKFKYEDPIYCLNQYTGFQLFQWSIERGLELGYLTGSPYRSTEGITLSGKAPLVRASAIGEPGNKSRVVTVGEGWLTIFLQPYAHALLDILKQDPEATAGLSRAWQGFEYVKRWAYQGHLPLEEERYILSSDLTTATDYCPHGYARALARGFIDGLGFDTPLTHLWADLLTSPRTYVTRDGKGTLTRRGVLMGDPGSKLILSLFNKVAEMEANIRFAFGHKARLSGKFLCRILRERGLAKPAFRLFAFAGDDHIAVGPVNYLKLITRSHIRNGMEVSTSTNYISRIGASYCEEILFINGERSWSYWGSKVPLYKRPYEDNPHVDALKLRLLSLCTKEHEGKNESNPAIGMSSTLRGMIAWFAEGWETTRAIVSRRFRQKMRRLIPQNLFLAALPRVLGGIECPVFDLTDIDLEHYWDQVPDLHKRIIAMVFSGSPDVDPALRRMVSRVSSMSAVRGVDPDSIEESIRAVLCSELCQSRAIGEFQSILGLDDLKWGQLRFTDKLRLISEKTEFISVGNAIQAVMRPYIFRDILFPEESLKHGICPFRTRAYANLHWQERFNRLYQAVEAFLEKKEEVRVKLNELPESLLEETRDLALQALSNPKLTDVQRDVVFIPRSVVFTVNLCTLQTPDLN